MSFGVGRISTLMFSQMNRDLVTRTTLSLQKAGQELSTGRRSDIFLELGPSATASLTLRSRLNEIDAFSTSNTLLMGRLQTQLNSVDTVRNQVQSVLETALANSSSPTAGAETLQLQARTALETVISQLNISFNGEALFGGTRSGVQPMTEYTAVNSSTGLSPEAVIASVVSGPPSTVSEAQSIFDDLDAIFDSTATVTSTNYEETFYSGTPALDSGGLPNRRVSARIEPGLDLQFGIQANDEPFREVIKGLSMLAAIDVSEIPSSEVYVSYMERVVEVLGGASTKTLTLTAEIGFRQQVVDTAQQRLDALSLVYENQVAMLENVDPYEAATRMQSLETQLRATYEVTAQFGNLSLLNYL